MYANEIINTFIWCRHHDIYIDSDIDKLYFGKQDDNNLQDKKVFLKPE